jgi:predicted RNA-binding Zn-ribbon protein involved in translation (DUF1610 family)
MTDRTAYYQAKNTEARLHGGLFRCPECISLVEHNVGSTDALDTYHCHQCGWHWDHNGDPMETKETP